MCVAWCFSGAEPSLRPWASPAWSRVSAFGSLTCAGPLASFASIFLRDFASIFMEDFSVWFSPRDVCVCFGVRLASSIKLGRLASASVLGRVYEGLVLIL